MKQQQAFVGTEKMLKGCLHCHTTRSDGLDDPDDVIRFYYENGYDFLALTDHRIYNFRNFAPEVPITIIPGMEFDNIFECGKGFRHFHTVCIGPSEIDGNGFRHDETMLSGTAKNQEEYQTYLDEFHAKGNLTIYCHPQWSATPARYFEKMQGNFAMEIWNTVAATINQMDSDAAYWDELLGQGKVIYGVATDDGHRMSHRCKGWVMVKTENKINAILNSLKNGAFYSSCGPEIYNFYVEDGLAVIECSPVSYIRFHSDMHPTYIVRSEESVLTRAEFKLGEIHGYKGEYAYIRVSIIDRNGKYAWTNPIFCPEKDERHGF